jgi:hypothetical protein
MSQSLVDTTHLPCQDWPPLMKKRTQATRKPKMDRQTQRGLVTAREDLAVAEQELKTALDGLPMKVRADKEMVSAALRLALDKLSDAKEKLEAVLDL